MKKIPVAVLGATGSVGQKFVALLEHHPWFEIVALCASERSAGKPYKEVVRWFMQTPLPEKYGSLVVQECVPTVACKIVFSGLDSAVARDIETQFAQAGYTVISNSKNHRWDPDVPLVVPEINSSDLCLVQKQNFNSGAIVTNPNCSTIGLVLALKPLLDQFGLTSVNVVTLQALSGAGYPGVPSLDIVDNVVPFIGGEEEKVEQEPQKIFGRKIPFSAQCNRVAVLDGHLECVQVKLEKKASSGELIAAWTSFRSEPQKLDLPMAPLQPIHYFAEEFFPQPKLHRNLDKGMAVSVGRLRPCSLFDYKFVILSHNTVRGAAGGTILIAETMVKKNLIPSVSLS